MALGLGSLTKKDNKTKVKKDDKQTDAKAEAAQMLKKMDEKAASGDCPFC